MRYDVLRGKIAVLPQAINSEVQDIVVRRRIKL